MIQFLRTCVISIAALITLSHASDSEGDISAATTPSPSTLTSVGGGQGFLMRTTADGSTSILLAKDTRFPHQLGCYGAAQGQGEFTDAAFMRGVHQKLGVSLDPNHVRPVASWQRVHANSEGANDHCCFYTGLIPTDTDVTSNPEFLSEASWYSASDVLEMLSAENSPIFEGIRPVLHHILGNYTHPAYSTPSPTTVADFAHPETAMWYFFYPH